MLYQVTTQQACPVLYTETAPGPLKKYALAGSRAVAGQGSFGYFLFQELPVTETATSVWYNNYLLKQDEIFSHRSYGPNLCLHFALSNHFAGVYENGQAQTLHQGHFNLYYHPQHQGQVSMHPGRIYSLFSMYCSGAFLERWAPHSPALTRFMQKIKNNEPAVLCDCEQVTTVQMGKAIHEILDGSFMKAGLPYYISLKINELLIMVMDKVDHYPSTRQRQLHREDVERFTELKKVLLQSVEHPLSLNDLSRRFGLNVKKIKTGFKLLYETSPFDLLLDKRMERAKELLRESDLSIDDIGESVGYDNRHSFSKAFKKYAGHPPASYRKYKTLIPPC